jgi:type VI secretion system protein ImpM
MSAPRVAGWYGKIASLGDFASRRLPSAFIARWDAWLQEVIPASRAHLGTAWLDAYLSCPVWRFVLFPGVCERGTWAGVMMPSVDRVGRYFPLTIACELEAFATTGSEVDALADWLDRLDALARSTLDTAHDVPRFDRALAALRAPTIAAPRLRLASRIIATLHDDDPVLLALPSDDELASTLMAAGAILLAETAHGSSLWWTAGAAGAGAPLLACRGLPDGLRFAAMLQSLSPRMT